MTTELEAPHLHDPIHKFPAPGTPLARILYDLPFRTTFNSRLKRSNPFVIFFYRIGLLPLFGASRSIMILTTRGRRSGKNRHTPIGYFRIGGIPHIISAWGRSANWYQNLKVYPDAANIQIGLTRRNIKAAILEDPDEIWKTIDQLLTESPKIAQYLFGWDALTDRRDPADFSEVIHKVAIVRCQELTENKSND